MARIVMTRRGYLEMQERIRHLHDVKMPALEARLGAARELGDLSENAEYNAAREEIWLLEGQIKDLEEQYRSAEVVDNQGKELDAVYLGAAVDVVDLDTKKKQTFHIVGHGEADPEKNWVSINAPMGAGFLGKKKGDEVAIRVPAGVRKFKVVSYSYP